MRLVIAQQGHSPGLLPAHAADCLYIWALPRLRQSLAHSVFPAGYAARQMIQHLLLLCIMLVML
jgi:hypothetical protein